MVSIPAAKINLARYQLFLTFKKQEEFIKKLNSSVPIYSMMRPCLHSANRECMVIEIGRWLPAGLYRWSKCRTLCGDRRKSWGVNGFFEGAGECFASQDSYFFAILANMARAPFWISSGVRSLVWLARLQEYPNGSSTVPIRSPQNMSSTGI